MRERTSSLPYSRGIKAELESRAVGSRSDSVSELKEVNDASATWQRVNAVFTHNDGAMHFAGAACS